MNKIDKFKVNDLVKVKITFALNKGELGIVCEEKFDFIRFQDFYTIFLFRRKSRRDLYGDEIELIYESKK